jgi:hypothetical protein
MQTLDEGREVTAGGYEADIAAYLRAMSDAGLVVLPEYIERKIANLDLAVAGTCDNLVRRGDTIHVADKKTGATVDFGFLEMPAQLAGYAGGKLWDVEADVALPTPDIDQETGFIIHVPAGEGRCDIWAADLSSGRLAIELAARVREIRKASKTWMIPFEKFAALADGRHYLDDKTKDELLAVANGDYDLGIPKGWTKAKIVEAIRAHEADDPKTLPGPTEATPSSEGATDGGEERSSTTAETVELSPTDAPPSVEHYDAVLAGREPFEMTPAREAALDEMRLRRRIEKIIELDHAATLMARWPDGTPGLSEATVDQYPAILRAIERAEADLGLPFDPPPSEPAPPRTVVDAPPAPRPPDEGDEAPGDDIEAVRAAWGLMETDASDWVAAIAGRSGNLSMSERPSARRLLIGWSLIRLATAGWHDDELLEACLDHSHALDRDPVDDVALVLSRMDVHGATRFSKTVGALVAGDLRFSVSSEADRMRLEAA